MPNPPPPGEILTKPTSFAGSQEGSVASDAELEGSEGSEDLSEQQALNINSSCLRLAFLRSPDGYVEVPTSPPGGVHAVCSNINAYLGDFPLKLSTKCTHVKGGLKVRTKRKVLYVRVTPGEDWGYNRECWRSAIHNAPRSTATRQVNWRGLCTLEQEPTPLPFDMEPGDVVGLHNVPGRSNLNGTGALLLEATGEEDGDFYAWKVLPESDEDPPMVVPNSSIVQLPLFPLDGISLAGLREFRAVHFDLLSEITTASAVDGVVKTLTASARVSLTECLQRVDAKDRVTGAPFVAQATAFVTHAYQYGLLAMIEALEAFARRQREPDKVYFWLDFMSMPVHELPEETKKPALWFKRTFAEGMAAIGLTCLVLSPSFEPLPLARIWCLFEMACTLTQGSALAVALSTEEAQLFEQALEEDFEAVARTFSRVDITEGEAFTKADKKMLLSALEMTSNVDAINEQVVGWLRECVIATGRAKLNRLKRSERCSSSLMGSLGAVYQRLGRLEEAEALGREAMEIENEVHGEAHPNTLHAVNNVAVVLWVQDKLTEAEPLAQKALQGYRVTLGNKHSDTLTCIANLAHLLQAQGRLKEAEPLSREALAGKRAVMGSRHPHSLILVGSLAQLLHAQGKLAEAEPLYREAMQGQREVLGSRHPSTLISLGNLAALLQEQGKLAEAEPLFAKAVQGNRKVLGSRDPETLHSAGNYADLLRELGKMDEARKVMGDVVAIAREVLAPGHRIVLKIEAQAARLYLGSSSEPESPSILAPAYQQKNSGVAQFFQHQAGASTPGPLAMSGSNGEPLQRTLSTLHARPAAPGGAAGGFAEAGLSHFSDVSCRTDIDLGI